MLISKMLVVWCIVIAASCGYVMNIVKLVKCDFVEPYKEEAIRVVGIVPPVGVVVGWINFEDVVIEDE